LNTIAMPNIGLKRQIISHYLSTPQTNCEVELHCQQSDQQHRQVVAVFVLQLMNQRYLMEHHNLTISKPVEFLSGSSSMASGLSISSQFFECHQGH
jgi:hypothetical protein